MNRQRPFTVLAFSVLGMSMLPFLAICVQYMDATVGPVQRGYRAEYMDYVFHGPLLYPLMVLVVIALCSCGMIIKKWSKREES